MSNKCIIIKPKENSKCFYHIITATLVCLIYHHDLPGCLLPNHCHETIEKSAAVQAFSTTQRFPSSNSEPSQAAESRLIFV